MVSSSVCPSKMSTIKRVILVIAVLSILPASATPVQDVEAQWRIQHEAGLEALRQGRNQDAARSFRSAIREAEEFGSQNYRLAESFGGMLMHMCTWSAIK
jgi:hypothetical protein